jgi:cell division control protein 24
MLLRFRLSSLVDKATRLPPLALVVTIPQKTQQLQPPMEDSLMNDNDNVLNLLSVEGTELSSFDFENDLETSRVYRRAQRDTMDFSFRSSTVQTHAWSQFSGLSLSDVSIISAIALPMYAEQLENSQHHAIESRGAMATTKSTLCDSNPKSPYQDFIEIEARLAEIPGFPEIFSRLRDSSEENDPLSFLIRVFRSGTPLLIILERVPGVRKPSQMIQARDITGPEKMAKAAAFNFIQACREDLGFLPGDCFSLADLYGDDSTGFMKVSRTITNLENKS